MSWEILRTVSEHATVSDTIDGLSQQFPRLREAWDGLTWLLCRNPTPHGSVRRMVGVDEHRLYVLAGDSVAKTPSIWVVYRHTDNDVDILGANAVVLSDEDE